MQRLARIYDLLTEACGRLAALVILGVTVLMTSAVLLRNLADGTTIPGDIELSEYAMLLITAFAAPWLLKRGQHVRIDLVLTAIPRRAAWLCEIATDLTGTLLSVLLAYYSIRAAAASQALGTRMVKDFMIPEWWVLTPLPLMFVLLAVGFVLRLHALAAGVRAPRHETARI
jgi:TRAP-type C4-dicarboxylate transport system permease small subunit